MTRWRKEAFDRLPELRRKLQEEKSAYGFFHEVVNALESAHLRREDDMIRRIYAYANWCLQAPRGKDSSDDMLTIMAVSFFESLPLHPVIRKNIGHWLPKATIE